MNRASVGSLVGAALALSLVACDKKDAPASASSADRSSVADVSPGSAGDGPRQIKGPPGFMDPGKRAARLHRQLGLSAEQTAKVEAALRDNADPETRKAAVRALLTRAQATRYDELTGARDVRPMIKGGDNTRTGSSPVRFAERLQRHLSLTDEQTEKLATVLAESGSREQRMAAIKAVLTAEQFARYESMYSGGSDPATAE